MIVAGLISTYPYLLALFAAMLAETCAILIRLVAPSVSRWLWWLANGISLLSLACFLWSFYWAASIREDFLEVLSVPETMLGVLGIVGGIGLFLWSFAVLRWRSLFAWPNSTLGIQAPYAHIRRPMFIGIAFLFMGIAFLLSRDSLWIWLGTWLLLAQGILELEEWELRMRFQEAEAYFARTRRYLPRLNLRSK